MLPIWRSCRFSCFGRFFKINFEKAWARKFYNYEFLLFWMKKERFPEGHFMGQGIAIGICIGVAVGAAMGNVALGPAIGVAIGVAIGAGMEEKAKKEGRVRKLTMKEKKRRRIGAIVAFVVGVLVAVGIGVLVFSV